MGNYYHPRWQRRSGDCVYFFEAATMAPDNRHNSVVERYFSHFEPELSREQENETKIILERIQSERGKRPLRMSPIVLSVCRK